MSLTFKLILVLKIPERKAQLVKSSCGVFVFQKVTYKIFWKNARSSSLTKLTSETNFSRISTSEANSDFLSQKCSFICSMLKVWMRICPTNQFSFTSGSNKAKISGLMLMIPYSFNPLTHSHFVYVFLDSLSPRMNYILPKCPSLVKTSLAT